MFVQNLQLEILDYELVKSEVKSEIAEEADPGEVGAKEALTEMYMLAEEKMQSLYLDNPEEFLITQKQAVNLTKATAIFWEKIRKFLCGVLKSDSTASEIIDAILECIIGLVPGGIFIKALVKKVVRYLLNLGYENLCPA